jgi:uncharacterized protein YbjT (DUF2867 family)
MDTREFQRILVAGATGGVGQLTVARLLARDWPVRVLTRSAEKARRLFADRVEVVEGNLLQPRTLTVATDGVDAIICCTGTTAFPSNRWQFDSPETFDPIKQFIHWGRVYLDSGYRQQHSQNNPMAVDAQGVINLLTAAAPDLKQFILISSCGVERRQDFPFSLLNAFGVLDAKAQGEAAVRQSGLAYTILRPGRLTDGPYTAYDLNTLIKASTGGKQGIVLGTGDRLNGQTSRGDVATACIASLIYPDAKNKVFEIINQGVRPATIDWADLLRQL